MVGIVRPAPDIDLSAYVLASIDDHLAAMRQLRDRMRISSTAEPGGRWLIAADSVAAAKRYADEVARALDALPVDGLAVDGLAVDGLAVDGGTVLGLALEDRLSTAGG